MKKRISIVLFVLVAAACIMLMTGCDSGRSLRGEATEKLADAFAKVECGNYYFKEWGYVEEMKGMYGAAFERICYIDANKIYIKTEHYRGKTEVEFFELIQEQNLAYRYSEEDGVGYIKTKIDVEAYEKVADFIYINSLELLDAEKYKASFGDDGVTYKMKSQFLGEKLESVTVNLDGDNGFFIDIIVTEGEETYLLMGKFYDFGKVELTLPELAA